MYYNGPVEAAECHAAPLRSVPSRESRLAFLVANVKATSQRQQVSFDTMFTKAWTSSIEAKFDLGSLMSGRATQRYRYAQGHDSHSGKLCLNSFARPGACLIVIQTFASLVCTLLMYAPCQSMSVS